MSYLTLLVDRQPELSLLLEMLRGDRPQRILNICESGGRGKSFLVKAFRQMCQGAKSSCSLIEFAFDQRVDPISCMRDIVEQLGEEKFPEFSRQDIEFHRPQPIVKIGGGGSNTEVSLSGSFPEAEVSAIAGHDNITINDIQVAQQEVSRERKLYIVGMLTKIFKKELTSFSATHAVALVFDGYEHAPEATASWIQKHLLRTTRDGLFSQLLIVLSGRPEGTRPKFTPIHEWSNILINVTSLSEFKLHDVHTYFSVKRKVELDQPDLEAYYRVCRNNPLIMGQIADILDANRWLNQ